jgi:hydrogenase 3 maturation protease
MPSARSIPELVQALHNRQRIVVVGVGSELRGDDIAGVLVARKLRAWCIRKRISRLVSIVGGTAPENITGEVIRYQPELVVLVDAAHLGKEAGTVEIVSEDQIQGVTFSTHMLPAPIFLDYLKKSTNCQSLVVGIEPAQKEVVAKPSPVVLKAVEQVVVSFKEALASGRES